MSDFYLTLHSNAHEGGNTGHFFNRLPQPIHLQGQYEVALTSIIYPMTWNNMVRKKENETKQNTSTMLLVFESTYIEVDVENGHFHTVAELISAINYSAKIKGEELLEQALMVANDTKSEVSEEWRNFYNTLADQFEFQYNETNRRVKVETKGNRLRQIHLSNQLKYMLGFGSRFLTKTELAKYPPDVTAGLNMLCIYTDIVEPQVFGSAKTQLLRVVAVKRKNQYGDIVENTFAFPQYIPLTIKDLNKIEISIRFDSGSLVDFNFGKSVLTLHFRKRRMLLQ